MTLNTTIAIHEPPLPYLMPLRSGVPMLSKEVFPTCPAECHLEFGPDDCQAYGVPCVLEGRPRQEFACHAGVCRCGACPLPWPRCAHV